MINRAYEYEELLRESSKKIITSIDKGDVVATASYSQSVHFEHDKLQNIEDVSYFAIATRLFENGKVGNSHINDPKDHKDLIKNAKESAKFGQEIDIELPSAQEYRLLDWQYSPKNLNYSKKDLKELAETLLAEIKKFAPDAKVSTSTYNSCSLNYLENTSGFKGEYDISTVSLQGGLFELGKDDSFIEIYESYSFYDTDYDIKLITDPLKERLMRSRQQSPLTKTGKMPVIFAPSVMDLVLTPIEIALNGKTLSKEMSLFANRQGEEMFDPKFSLRDDPFYKHSSGSCPFDDEGTIGKPMDLIKDGIFNEFIFDCSIAKKMNAKSTGHASRGIQSLPAPALSNRIIGLGSNSLEEMIASIDYGLMLVGVLGEGQSNVIAGDFSVLGETAYLIENGQLKGRVKDLMISGNSFELLKKIEMIENKLHKEYSLHTPHYLLDGVSVSKNI